jgi:hypothetical protein
MARLIQPTTRAGRSDLFGKVLAKHILDGVGSILTPFFTEDGIVIGDITTANNAANAAFVFFDAKQKASETMFKDIINTFDAILGDHKMCVQSAKAFYRKNTSKLGAFGVTLNGNRVVYSKNRKTLCDDMMNFINYNNSLAVGLRPITATFQTNNKMDLAANLLALPGIKTEIDAYDQEVIDKESSHGTFSVEEKTVIAFLRAVGQFLMLQFPLNPKKAGDWGFVVDDSPQDAKEKIKKFKKGQTANLYDIVAGSILQNTGDSIQEITKGKAGTGTAIVLNPGDYWKVLPGYTTLKAKSMGILLTGEITYLKNH